MAQMPMAPENWLAGDQDGGTKILPLAPDQETHMEPLPLARDDKSPTISNMMSRYPQWPRGTSLSLFMEPNEIAAIPGLPDHVYEGVGGYADQRLRQDPGAAGTLQRLAAGASPTVEGQPAGYVSTLDKVSLAPPDWYSSELDLSKPAHADPKNPIGPVQGYPEDGRHAWRASNDDAIVAAAGKYNCEHGYRPGDMEYITPQLMKSWMMRESGGTPKIQIGRGPTWAITMP